MLREKGGEAEKKGRRREGTFHFPVRHARQNRLWPFPFSPLRFLQRRRRRRSMSSFFANSKLVAPPPPSSQLREKDWVRTEDERKKKVLLPDRCSCLYPPFLTLFFGDVILPFSPHPPHSPDLFLYSGRRLPLEDGKSLFTEKPVHHRSPKDGAKNRPVSNKETVPYPHVKRISISFPPVPVGCRTGMWYSDILRQHFGFGTLMYFTLCFCLPSRPGGTGENCRACRGRKAKLYHHCCAGEGGNFPAQIGECCTKISIVRS